MAETQGTRVSRWKAAGEALRGFRAAGEAIVASHELKRSSEKDAQSRRRAKALDDERAARAAPLHFGDVVCLSALSAAGRPDGWLRADGLVVNRVELARGGEYAARDFASCLFRVCPALQFEASAELERASRAYDRVGPDELARLREMREAEAAKNARTLAQLARAGASAGARAARRPVKYGDDVQLRPRHARAHPTLVSMPRRASIYGNT